MRVRYATRKLERICTDESRMKKTYGSEVAKTLKLRLAELKNLPTMSDLLLGTGKWEQLSGNRSEHWSARLTANWRLIVEPEYADEIIVIVVEIVDYH